MFRRNALFYGSLPQFLVDLTKYLFHSERESLMNLSKGQQTDPTFVKKELILHLYSASLKTKH